jgi:amino acid adenylation domain-containing protein
MSEPAARMVDLSPQEKRALLTQLLRSRAGQSPTRFPLSYGQQALWLTHQLAPESWAYNVLFSARIRSEVDIPALQGAFQALLDRHPTLRTTYTVQNGEPAQQIHEHLPLHFEATDASTWGREILRERLTAEARRPFDLQRGPLMRVGLFTQSATDHALLLTMHHIAIDFWSLGLLLDELRMLYPAEKAGIQASLPPLGQPYMDYVRRQAQTLAGPEHEQLWAYWQHQLGGELPVLSLPTDRPRLPAQTYYGATHPFTLSEELTRQLKACAKAAGVTLYVTLLAAFHILLHRYTGQDDILVGTFMAGRLRPEFRRTVGYFVNPVVIRAGLSGNLPFTTFLAQEHHTVLEALKYQELPFPILVERLQPVRDASRSPLFQVAFILQQLHLQEELLQCFVPGTTGAQINFGELILEPFALPQQEGQFDLTLEMAEVGPSLWGGLKYNTDLFNAATISRMAGHFQTLLEGIATNPGQSLSALPLSTETERQRLLGVWNNITAHYPSYDCLHQLFEAQVERTPEATAVVCEEAQLTYYELNRRANKLAHHLQSLGVGPEMLVGICVERSVEMVVGLLGILKAGGAYVPLDPAYPKARLAFILEDAQVSVLLTQEHLAAELPEHGAQVVCLDADRGIFAQQNEVNPRSGVMSSNLAYVIYTSGSTGKPKGVLVSHRNVVRLFTATHAWFRFDARDVWTLFHSYAFDFSVWEFWGALLYGGRLVVVPFWMSRSPTAFYDLLCREGVTVLNQTPSAFRQLVREEEDAVRPAKELTLRLVIFGGEALDVQSIQSWFARHGDEHPQLVNMYGITETTVHVTYRPLTMADVREAWGSPIGIPIPDLQLYLLDAHLNPVPIGVPGELHVGGAGVARGYLNRPELTTTKFIYNPFSTEPGARLYKSGDLARYLPDGSLEYLGRIDQQVQIRGFRVEPGEIETVLGQHPAVRETIVMAREDTPGDKRLVAYVVSEQPSTPTYSALRDFLKAKLPDYMVPSAFVRLDALPLTTNGKVDRRALPAPDHMRPDLDSVFVAPHSPVEKTLAEIWCQSLGIDRVGLHDNFFDLGGDSIRSLQVQSTAQGSGLHFALHQLFQYQTIYELAQVVSTAAPSSGATSQSQAFSLISQEDRWMLPDDVEDAYPLSMLQAEMIFYSQHNPDSAIYHDVFSYYLRLRFDLQAWSTAWHRLVRRHAILRTSFDCNNFSEPLQLVHHTARIPLEAEDLCHLSARQQEEALIAWREAEKTRHFDWALPPLLRVQVHRRTEETFQLTLSFHHAILDGWSVASMLTELLQYYVSLLNATASPAEPLLAFTFRDFVAQERQALSSTVYQHYWDQRLHNATMTMLPRGPSHRQTMDTSQNRDLEIPIVPQVFEGLQRLARFAAAPLKSVLLAAHLRVLSLLSDRTEVLTGLVSHGRPEGPDTERVLGMFLNVIPLCLKLPGGSWRDLVVATFQAEQECFPFRHYPIAHLPGSENRLPIFETVFNFINFHIYLNLSDLRGFEYLVGEYFDPFPYTLKANFIVNPLSSDLLLSLNYNYDVLHEEKAQAIGSCYTRVLTAMAAESWETLPAPEKAFQKGTLQEASVRRWKNVL